MFHACCSLLLLALNPASAQGQQERTPPIPADTTVETTASGLQYCVLAPGGPGPHPKLGDRVRVQYTGWLADGNVFDSSRGRGQPAEFILGNVIPGWNEGLQLMTPGARWKLTIPPALAYGDRGQPPRIPPGATLIFEVELLEVIAMPVFRAANPAAQKTTESGLRYETIVEGGGPAPEAGDVFVLEYALWTSAGKLLDCSEARGAPLKGRLADMRLPFLEEAPLLLRVGARLRFEVPPALGFGDRAAGPDLPPNSTTVWELELVRVLKPLPVPAFVPTPGEKILRTASGLGYEVIQEGSGAAPEGASSVTVHYAGWLADGTLFDSSYGRGEPATFELGRLIPGWSEGLLLMKVGGIYQFTIPPDLAYGERGAPPLIGPGATLVFRVELIGVGR